jgi:hypothetical protein
MTLPVNVMTLPVNVMAQLVNVMTLFFDVMARLVRATCTSILLREVPRTSRGMTWCGE